jgi:hypothetical protein
MLEDKLTDLNPTVKSYRIFDLEDEPGISPYINLRDSGKYEQKFIQQKVICSKGFKMKQ